jgi:hypothetical protein
MIAHRAVGSALDKPVSRDPAPAGCRHDSLHIATELREYGKP